MEEIPARLCEKPDDAEDAKSKRLSLSAIYRTQRHARKYQLPLNGKSDWVYSQLYGGHLRFSLMRTARIVTMPTMKTAENRLAPEKG